MGRINPLVLIGLLLVILFKFFVTAYSQSIRQPTFVPLSGVIHSGQLDVSHSSSMAISNSLNVPRVDLFIEDVGKIGLSNGTTHFYITRVPEEQGRFRAVFMEITASPVSSPHSVRQSKQVSVATTPEKVPQPASSVKTSTADASTPDGTTQPIWTYRQLDHIIQMTPATYTMSRRHKNGGVTFRIYSVSKWQNAYLAKCSIVNEEEKDFFVSLANVLADGRSVGCYLAMPLSCRPGEEIFGVIKFDATGTAQKAVSIQLTESGGAYRKFPIRDLDYPF